MEINAMLAGKPERVFSADAEPHDTIAAMLDRITQRLRERGLPSEFTAYSAKQNGQLTLSLRTLDFYALQYGEPEAIARYITPAAQLEPTKTVADYFGTTAETQKISVVVYWTAKSWREYNDQLARAEIEPAAKAAAVNATEHATIGPPIPMLLPVLVVGHQDFVFSVPVKPHDTIATMVDTISQLCPTILGSPRDFTVHSTERDGQWPVHFDAFDFYALMFGDPAAVSRYITPATQLDPTKTVYHYIGTARIHGTIQIVVNQTPTSSKIPDEDDRVVCAHIETVMPDKTRGQALEVGLKHASSVAAAAVLLSWQSVWSCFSPFSCRPHGITSCLDAAAAKKNN